MQIMYRSVLKIFFLKSLEAVEHFSYLWCLHPMTDRGYMIGQKRSLFQSDSCLDSGFRQVCVGLWYEKSSISFQKRQKFSKKGLGWGMRTHMTHLKFLLAGSAVKIENVLGFSPAS